MQFFVTPNPSSPSGFNNYTIIQKHYYGPSFELISCCYQVLFALRHTIYNICMSV